MILMQNLTAALTLTGKIGEKLKSQGKNSRFRQIHLVELPKTGPISKPDIVCSWEIPTLYF